MTREREAEIVAVLQSILASFQPTPDQPEPDMFWLISNYNRNYPNPELIGGQWAREHGFDLPS